MSRDARKPVIPIGVEESETHALLLRNGETRSAFNVTLSHEDLGRMKAGYVCVRCYEVQDTPHPKECWVCKFPMAERQAEYLAKAFQGEQHMGPTISLEDELAMLEEAEEMARREVHGFRPISVQVPRSI